MNYYVTKLKAIDVSDGELKLYCGPYIKAISFEEAEHICKTKFPYLKVDGQLIEEIPFDEETGKIDYENRVNFVNQNLN